MNGAREQLLARAALAEQQHGGVRRGDLPGGRQRVAHHLAAADQLAAPLERPQLGLEIFGLLPEPLDLALGLEPLVTSRKIKV